MGKLAQALAEHSLALHALAESMILCVRFALFGSAILPLWTMLCIHLFGSPATPPPAPAPDSETLT